jgi:hypothetical protein
VLRCYPLARVKQEVLEARLRAYFADNREGIDVDNIDVPDVQTLQRALNRTMERHNMSLFTPVCHARELAAVTLRLGAEAIADGDTQIAATALDQAQPESPDGSAPTVAACTGLALAADYQVELSHGQAGQCWDNALAESFFGSIKGELLDLQSWPTRTSARRAVTEYIGWYNGTRLHSAIGIRHQQNSKPATTTRSGR